MEPLDMLKLRRAVEKTLETEGANVRGAGMFVNGTSADISFDYKGKRFIAEITEWQSDKG